MNRTFPFTGIVCVLVSVFTCRPLIALPSGTGPDSAQLSVEVFEADTAGSDSTTIFRKNILSLDILLMFPALGYSRIVPLTKSTSLVFYTSITPYFGFIIDTGAAASFGKNQHHFEPAGGYLIRADNFYIKAGYRYQGRKGFVFKVAPGYSISKNVPWFTAGFGYAF